MWQPGQAVVVAGQYVLGNIAAIVFLRGHVLAAEIGGEVDPQARHPARERAVPGVAVPDHRRAGRDLDGDRVRIALVAAQPHLPAGRLAVQAVAAGDHGQAAAASV